MEPDLGTIFRRVKHYIDEGYSWHYATSLAGIKKHRLSSLLSTCPELQDIRAAYYAKKPMNQKWP